MSAAPLLAGSAAACAAGALGELATLARSRSQRGLLAGVVRRLGRALGARAPRALPARMAAAGVDADVADMVALKAGLALLSALVALPVAAAAPGRLGLAAMVAAPAAGFWAPDAWLRRRTVARRRAIEAELADVLDLLRVAVAAGLSPRRALGEVGRRHAGVLAGELRRAAERASLGEPAERALADLRVRAPGAGVTVLVDTLVRAERHGAPLADALAAQALEARSRSAHRAAEAAARAAPKIQLVVALLLVPAVLLLVAAALLPALGGGA